jgi:hypothetical protein
VAEDNDLLLAALGGVPRSPRRGAMDGNAAARVQYDAHGETLSSIPAIF